MSHVLPGLVRCTSCGTLRIYPKPLCSRCHGSGIEPATVTGEGTLYSYTIVHRAPEPRFRPELPYVVALVDLDEGVRIPGRLACSPEREPRCGQRVRLVTSGDRPHAEFVIMEDAHGSGAA